MTGIGSRYDRVARIYDAVAEIYSFGRIRRSKRAVVRHLSHGERVLFLGVGRGEEAVRAAAAGAQTFCIDLSPVMIDIVRRKFAAKNLTGVFIVGDVLDHVPQNQYDVVVANYFFNVFSAARMLDVLAHAAQLVRPGGRLMIADIAKPEGSWLGRLFVRFYARLGMLPFWLAGLVAWHPIHDYAAHFCRFQLKEEAREDFPLFPFGPTMFRLIIARKTGDDRANEAA